MTVEATRRRYQALWSDALIHDDWCALYRGDGAPPCEMTDRFWLRVDAASIVLDLATAEDCARRSVAYA